MGSSLELQYLRSSARQYLRRSTRALKNTNTQIGYNLYCYSWDWLTGTVGFEGVALMIKQSCTTVNRCTVAVSAIDESGGL